ncbi:MAG: hypothetical protein H6657_25185 [Ardenticatenaceae bacterium]|nr:hypothetical protein [Ardenticatenaceae bacterium]
MYQVTFIRATHENGRFRPYPTEAYQFWADYGWLVGEVLRQEEGMRFAEIVQACTELLDEHPGREPNTVSEKYIAWCLVKLLEFGMVATVENALDDKPQS